MLSAFWLQIMMQRSPLAYKFPRVIEKKLSKDTSCIWKSKMAAGGHLGKPDRLVVSEPFVIETIVIHLFQLIWGRWTHLWYYFCILESFKGKIQENKINVTLCKINENEIHRNFEYNFMILLIGYNCDISSLYWI